MLKVQAEGLLARAADCLMMPIMYVLSGTLKERPQRTHFWNNQKMNVDEIVWLHLDGMVHCAGAPEARSRWWGWLPRFHIPIFGGWREYVVLEPIAIMDDDWFVGWYNTDIMGVSRVRLRSRVRMLLGPDDVLFFGITADGKQVPLRQAGKGVIGGGGPHAKTPLL